MKCKVKKKNHFIISRTFLRGCHSLLRSPGADQRLFGPPDTPGETSARASTQTAPSLSSLAMLAAGRYTRCSSVPRAVAPTACQTSASEEWQSCRKRYYCYLSLPLQFLIVEWHYKAESFLCWANAYANHGALLKRSFRAKIWGTHLLNLILYEWDRLRSLSSIQTSQHSNTSWSKLVHTKDFTLSSITPTC